MASGKVSHTRPIPLHFIVGSGSNDFYIFLGLASIPVIFTIIGCVYMIKTNCTCNCSCSLCKTLEKRDVNDIYGTYARGWDGEGDYGDGDKVYVSDSNTYYGINQ